MSATSTINNKQMPPTSPRGKYNVNLKVYRGSDFKGFPNKHSLITGKMWAAKKTQ